MIKTIETLRSPADPALLAITQAPVISIFPSATNPRKTFDKTDLQELTASVRQHGVLQPILVRPFPPSDWFKSGTPLYEIVAGERRWRAAQSAGLQTIDVKVRDLSDREVLEIQVIENLQRADLHPLEEADGYGRMMRDHGYTADQLAEKIGKSRAYIYGRTKLLDLIEEGRHAFLEGLLNPSSALLLARVPTLKLQSKALGEVIAMSPTSGEAASVRQVKNLLQRRYMLDLAEASFPRDDRDLLPKAGRCVDCPKRTGHQPEIFDDIDSKDICTDPDCYEQKKAAHAARIAAEAQARGLRVISGKEAREVCPNGVPLHRGYEFVSLDACCDDDREGRTYRELLEGASIAITLIEDARRSGALVESVECSTLEQYLAEHGVIADRVTEKKKIDAENKKLDERLRIENAWRVRVWDDARNGASAIHVTSFSHQLFRIVAAAMWRGVSWQGKIEIAEKMGLNGKKVDARVAEIEDSIQQHMSRLEICRLLIDMSVVSDATANRWDIDRKPPTTLLAVAKFQSIDTDAIRKLVVGVKPKAAKISLKTGQSETKAAESETPDANAENDLPATIAAQARGADAAEKPAEAALAPTPVSPDVKAMFSRPAVPVKYRGPNGETWSGRGKKPNWIEAWIAAGKSVDDLVAKAKSEEPIEMNEEPIAAEPELDRP